MHRPVIGDRKELREKVIHMLFEIAVVMVGDVTEQSNKKRLGEYYRQLKGMKYDGYSSTHKQSK